MILRSTYIYGPTLRGSGDRSGSRQKMAKGVLRTVARRLKTGVEKQKNMGDVLSFVDPG